MKKTMITLAAMFAATVTMAAVTSQVVGYNTVTLDQGFTVLTPTFEALATGNLTYKDIKLVAGSDYDMFQAFDENGDVVAKVYYWADDQSWYNYADDSAMNDEQIPLGTAFFFSSANGGSMIISGKVLTDAVEITLNQGYTSFGNPYPVPVKYVDLTVSGLVDYDMFQIFDLNGDVVEKVYFWVDDQSWYNYADDSAMNDVEIPAGKGFFFSAANTGATIAFPALAL